jgi:hypothetical protein
MRTLKTSSSSATNLAAKARRLSTGLSRRRGRELEEDDDGESRANPSVDENPL